MDKYIILEQILKNQRHILEVLDEMYRAGNVSPGMYHFDSV
ncbi:hypothetical protein LCGC14_3164940, partial [marine sediment metagenome]